MRRSVEFSYEDIVKRNERRGFTSMVKPVGSLCNMRCKYCYYLDKAALYNNHQPQMDDALLESYIRANIEGNNSHIIAFAWHGGEPLLAGKDFFRKAVALQQRYAGGKSVENSIQTNGLLIDDEWCQIFRDNNFLVGVSIDGPESIHDAHRVDAGGNPTFARVMKGIERLYRNRVEYNTLNDLAWGNDYYAPNTIGTSTVSLQEVTKMKKQMQLKFYLRPIYILKTLKKCITSFTQFKNYAQHAIKLLKKNLF